jgi:hypothetical protein
MSIESVIENVPNARFSFELNNHPFWGLRHGKLVVERSMVVVEVKV